MRKCSVVILLCVAVLSAVGQTPASKYQRGTITAVTAHQNAPGESDVARYDVSVKVGNTVYVVLLTPPSGVNSAEYSTGIDILVLVGDNTLTFNSQLTGKTEMPILRRETLPAQDGLDWSKAPSQYFSMKLQRLKEKLALTDEQQAEIKPILEQETAEVGQICLNPVLSRPDKLKQYKKILRTSNENIKPLLSASQLQKLQDLRKEQEQDLKLAEQKSEGPCHVSRS